LVSSFTLWPFSVRGRRGEQDFVAGHVYDLAYGTHLPEPCGGVLSFVATCYTAAGNPIRVVSVTCTSLSFLSLPGHSEGAGDTITFKLTLDTKGDTMLTVGAKGPSQWYDALPGVHWFRQSVLAHGLWSKLADNLRSRFNRGK
jgi:hypothetical protein